MGVVVRQSFWSSLIAYIGVGVGYINTLFLRTAFMDTDEIGLFTLVMSNALMLAPFCTLGMSGAFIKLFPEYKDRPDMVNRMVTFQLVIVIIVDLILIGIASLNQGLIGELFIDKSPEYLDYLGVSAFILIFHTLFEILLSYSRSMLAIVFPTFLRDVFLRLGTTVILLMLGFDLISFDLAVKSLTLTFAAAFMVFTGFLVVKYRLAFRFDFGSISKPEYRRLFWFAGYMLLLAGSFSVIQNVSYLQVSSILGLEAQGVFVTCFYIGMIVEMPRRNMLKVISPLFAQAFKDGRMKDVDSMYKKGSITLSVFGVLLLIGIVTNVQDLFDFIPKGGVFEQGYYVVLLVCSAKVISMVFGFSSEVLVFSDLYRYNLYFQILSALLLIVLNILLIPDMGINGAALAYFISLTILGFIKFLYIRIHFRISPFLKSHLILVFISSAVFLIFYFLPLPFGPILNIIVRSGLTGTVFMMAIYMLEVSPDINQLIRSTFDKVLPKR